jgi:hypothetical protein
LLLIELGKPNQNASIESFNGRLSGWVAQRPLVSKPVAARTRRDRTLRAGIQRRAVEEGVDLAEAFHLSEITKVARDSKQSRYLKREDFILASCPALRELRSLGPVAR